MSPSQESVSTEKQLLLIVEEALDIDAAARPAWLAEHCPAELLVRAQDMLTEVDDLDDETDNEVTLVAPFAGQIMANLRDTEMSNQTADSQALEIGTVIKDRFVIEDVLGEGGMGAVYRARDLRKEETQDRNPSVALKVLHAQFRSSPVMVMALQREARKAQTLAHPNIATVYDFDRDGDLVFMTMEWLQGEPLNELIARYPRGMSLDRVRGIIRGLCLGLAYAHNKQIIHSDFKPGNIFVTEDGATKILDFGIARAIPASEIGDSSDAQTRFDAGTLGAMTPAYATVEMFEGRDPSPADDVYALAIVIYQLLTGAHPYGFVPANEASDRGLEPHRIRAIKRREWQAIRHGLAFDKDDRSAHAAEFLREFEGSPRLRMALGFASAALVLTSGYVGYTEFQKASARAPEVSFEALPAVTQANFERLMSDADTLFGFHDYAGALVTYRQAYAQHPRNPRAVEAIVRVFETLAAAESQNDARAHWQALDENLRAVRQTDTFLATHPSLLLLSEQAAQRTEKP